MDGSSSRQINGLIVVYLYVLCVLCVYCVWVEGWLGGACREMDGWMKEE